jgi:hypothetical protein
MVASPEHIFAMKTLAARTGDVEELRTLAEELPSRSRGVLRELFD